MERKCIVHRAMASLGFYCFRITGEYKWIKDLNISGNIIPYP